MGLFPGCGWILAITASEIEQAEPVFDQAVENRLRPLFAA
jgi:hypothetical protein